MLLASIMSSSSNNHNNHNNADLNRQLMGAFTASGVANGSALSNPGEAFRQNGWNGRLTLEEQLLLRNAAAGPRPRETSTPVAAFLRGARSAGATNPSAGVNEDLLRALLARQQQNQSDAQRAFRPVAGVAAAAGLGGLGLAELRQLQQQHQLQLQQQQQQQVSALNMNSVINGNAMSAMNNNNNNNNNNNIDLRLANNGNDGTSSMNMHALNPGLISSSGFRPSQFAQSPRHQRSVIAAPHAHHHHHLQPNNQQPDPTGSVLLQSYLDQKIHPRFDLDDAAIRRSLGLGGGNDDNNNNNLLREQLQLSRGGPQQQQQQRFAQSFVPSGMAAGVPNAAASGLPTNNNESSASETRRMRGGVIEPFPEKLHRLLLEVEVAGRSDVISFIAGGRAFAIHKPERFFKDIVPLYFRQSRLSSFKRQLNLYGFELINTGPARGGYYHELFVKDRPDLCRRMRRVAVKVMDKQKPEPVQAEKPAAAAPVDKPVPIAPKRLEGSDSSSSESLAAKAK